MQNDDDKPLTKADLVRIEVNMPRARVRELEKIAHETGDTVEHLVRLAVQIVHFDDQGDP